MIRVASDEPFAGGDHRRDAALHVGGAAPVQHTVVDCRCERWSGPLIGRAGRYDVGMAGKGEERCLGAAARPQIVHRAESHVLDTEPEGLEALGKQDLAAGIVGGDRGCGDQCLGQFKGIGHGRDPSVRGRCRLHQSRSICEVLLFNE